MPKDDFKLSAKSQRVIDQGRETALAARAWEQMESEIQEAFQIRKLVPELTGRMDALEKQLARPVALQATLRSPAKPRATVRRPDAVRAVGDAAVAEFLRFTSQHDPDVTLKALYPDDDGRLCRKVARDLMRKSATSIGETTNVSYGADLVATDHMGWISSLERKSIFSALGGRLLPMGANQSITYAERAAADEGALAQSFVGESGTIPVKTGMLAGRTFSRVKAGVITVASNELVKVSVEDLRGILLEMIEDDTSQMLDATITNQTLAAVAGVRPASPWFGAPEQASVGTDLPSILADLAWLLAQVDRPAQPRLVIDTARELRLWLMRDTFGWVFREEMSQGKIAGIPYTASANCPTDRVYLIDSNDFARWLPVPEIDMSKTATIVMANDTPPDPAMTDTGAITKAGSIDVSDAAGTTPPTKVRSVFQTDSTALRVVQPVTWGMLRSGRTALLTGVGW